MSSKSLNKVLLIGNLTRDPLLKTTPNGASICTFSVATNTNYKKPNGEVVELTEFHNIVAWSKLADICAAKLKKGDKVYLEGELRSRLLDSSDMGSDYNNGTKDSSSGSRDSKYKKTEIRITEMILINSTSGKSGSADFDKDTRDDDFGSGIEEVPSDTLPI